MSDAQVEADGPPFLNAMNKLLDTTKVVGTAELAGVPHEVCAEAEATHDKATGQLTVNLHGFLRTLEHTHLGEGAVADWLPAPERALQSSSVRVWSSTRTDECSPGSSTSAASLSSRSALPTWHCSQQALAVAQYNLGIGAHIHDQSQLVLLVGSLG